MLLAGMQAIPGELYEAAAIDGADVCAALPLHHRAAACSRSSSITCLLSTIWTANSINFIYILTRGGPAGATMTFPMLAYEIGVDRRASRLGMAAAISLLFFPFFIVMIYFLTKRMLSAEAADVTTRHARFGLPPHRSSGPAWRSSRSGRSSALLDRRDLVQDRTRRSTASRRSCRHVHLRALREIFDQTRFLHLLQEQPAGLALVTTWPRW